MIIQGNLNYTTSGRKKKSYTKKKKFKEFVPLFPKKDHQFKPVWWEKQRQERKSENFQTFCTSVDNFIVKRLVKSIL